MLSALMITMLIGFAALAVDLSNMYRVRTESQGAVDAAALAGARELDGSSAGMTSAEDEAEAVGETHYAYAADIDLDSADIELGNWNSTTRTFTTPATSTSETNAVRVTHVEETVAHPFAAVLTGSASSSVSATAIALGGGPATVGCGFPMSLGSCTLESPGGGTECGGCLRMAAATSDNIGWANADPGGNTSTVTVGNLLEAACFTSDGSPNLDEEGNCAGSCATPTANEDEMQVGNGNNFTTNPNQFCMMLKELIRAAPNGVLRAQLPVFDASGGTTCNPSFTGTPVVEGYAQVEFLGARCGNADRDPIIPDELPTGCSTAGQRWIIARIACGVREDAPAGGGFFGLSARPVLVD